MEYNMKNIFLQKSYRKWGNDTSSRPSFCFLKELYTRQKQVVCSLILLYFCSAQLDMQ